VSKAASRSKSGGETPEAAAATAVVRGAETGAAGSKGVSLGWAKGVEVWATAVLAAAAAAAAGPWAVGACASYSSHMSRQTSAGDKHRQGSVA
jgi:hypothetical protein